MAFPIAWNPGCPTAPHGVSSGGQRGIRRYGKGFLVFNTAWVPSAFLRDEVKKVKALCHTLPVVSGYRSCRQFCKPVLGNLGNNFARLEHESQWRRPPV
jgi:hypothetical protein